MKAEQGNVISKGEKVTFQPEWLRTDRCSGWSKLDSRSALPQKSLSFTPGFSLVSSRNTNAENRFNGLPFFSRGNR